ncbi:hypothetical protein PYCC9005_004141 [Savitreella phatthalungensis]
MSYRQPPSRWKNQILTALKRDHWYSELDLTKDAIGNDACRTVQATNDLILFSGSTSVGAAPLSGEGSKFGYAHAKFSTGTPVSDLHVSPILDDRLLAVSIHDGQIRILKVPKTEAEEFDAPLHTFRASATHPNTPVLVQFHPQVSGVLAVASGTKVDLFSLTSGAIETTLEVPSPIVAFDWSYDGARIDVVSRDSQIRVLDARTGKEELSIKTNGNKPVLRALPGKQWLVSSISRMREREVHLYSFSDGGKVVKSWNFGTASTPLIPVVDNARKVVYLLDKSGSTLRWIEAFAPYNEGAASTGVEQASSAGLVHPLGLQIMEGEINRILIASVKQDMVPVSVTIGRKSYLEFHADLFLDVEVVSTISAQDWFAGQDSPAKRAQITPALVKKAASGESLAKEGQLVKQESASTLKISSSSTPQNGVPAAAKAETASDVKPIAPVAQAAQPNPSTPAAQPKPASNLNAGISAREARAFERLEAKENKKQAKPAVESAKEDLSTTRAREPDAKEPLKPETQKSEPGNNSLTELDRIMSQKPIDNEDDLEKVRQEHYKRIEASKAQATQAEPAAPLREVVKEDLNARRAEYGAPSSKGSSTREIVKEDLSSRRAEYGAPSPKKETLSSAAPASPVSRSTEVSAPTPIKPSPAKVDTTSSPRGVVREDKTSRRAEYGASAFKGTPGKVAAFLQKKQSSAATEDDEDDERPRSANVYREDLKARRAEYGAATPKLKHVTQANREIQRALGNPEPVTPIEQPKSQVEPYPGNAERQPSPSAKELEDAYAEDKTETESPKKDVSQDKRTESKQEKTEADAEPEIERKLESKAESPAKAAASPAKAAAVSSPAKLPQSPVKSNTSPMKSSPTKSLGSIPADGSHRDYTRKYLTGEMQHPRNSYTSLTTLNASLPNTARMVDATATNIAIPLAGPGGRVGVIAYDRPGRLPDRINGLVGGATVVDFELDRFDHGRIVTAHADQAVRVWTIPSDFTNPEAAVGDVEKPDRTISGLDRILQIAHHPHASNILLVLTALKLHLVDTSTGENIRPPTQIRGATNAAWALDGDSIAVARSDKSVLIIDAKSGEEKASFKSAHASTRPFRVIWVGEDRLVTAGFDRGSTRQVSLYNATSGDVLDTVELDISPSPFAPPHFDAMSAVLYLTPRGTSNVLPFHVQRSSLTALTSYSAADPVMGTAFLPPQVLDLSKVEVARCLRCSTGEISVVGFHIPRPEGKDVFHDDIYPDSVADAYTPAVSSSSAWLSSRSSPETVSLNTRNLPKASGAGIGVAARKPTNVQLATKQSVEARHQQQDRNAEEKPSELDQMFARAKRGAANGQHANDDDGDEPEFTNTAANTRWE